MGAGKYRHPITFQTPAVGTSATSDDNPPETWADSFKDWANRKALQGREVDAERMAIGEESAVWEIRFRTDVTRQMRIKDQDGDFWAITAIRDKDGRRRELEITTERRS